MNFANEVGYRRGEIDIVAEDSQTKEVVFVEVKSRKKNRYCRDPFGSITRTKYFRLKRIISNYLNRNKFTNSEYRLDAIAVEFDLECSKAKLKHLKHIYY